MRRETPIVTLDSDSPPQEWRRFTAALCLMTFYAFFVRAGLRLWEDGLREYHRGRPDASLYTSVASLCLAAVMYLCGRSLWVDGKWRQCWLVIAAAAMLGSTWTTLSYQDRFYYSGPLNGYTLGARVSETAGYALAFAQDIPFLAVLGWSAWRAGSRARPSSRLRPWVHLAVIWCLLSSLLVILSGDLPYRLRPILTPLGAGFLAIPLSLLLPAATGVLLTGGLAAAARWLALVVATLIIANGLFNGYAISLLVESAIDALLVSGIPGSLPDWSPFPLHCFLANRTFFTILFVDSVLQAGPWILIAVYARKYPLRVPPDDGSPFPRSYCGHCWYNLHGIVHDVCPECGRPLR